jgi:hypothetical protein
MTHPRPTILWVLIASSSACSPSPPSEVRATRLVIHDGNGNDRFTLDGTTGKLVAWGKPNEPFLELSLLEGGVSLSVGPRTELTGMYEMGAPTFLPICLDVRHNGPQVIITSNEGRLQLDSAKGVFFEPRKR